MSPAFIGPIFDVLKQVLSGLGLDPEAKARAQVQAFEALTNGTFDQRAELQQAIAQLDVNKAEASSGSVFASGWRPFIGWTCGVALAVQFVFGPLAQWAGGIVGHTIPPIPSLDDVLWQLLFGMLGLGALRTVEKVKGKA